MRAVNGKLIIQLGWPNVSYYIVGHAVPRTISVPCGLFLKKGGTISCVVTGPRQPRYSRDVEKLYSVISSTSSSVSANLHVPLACMSLSSQSIRTDTYMGPRKYSVP